MWDYLGSVRVDKDSPLDKRIEQYKKEVPEGEYNEELLTLVSEAITKGDIKYNEGAIQPVKDALRRLWNNYTNKDIEFNTGKDVFNFIKDIITLLKLVNGIMLFVEWLDKVWKEL